jgi:quercetin dioxygenase-like cupin family protein
MLSGAGGGDEAPESTCPSRSKPWTRGPEPEVARAATVESFRFEEATLGAEEAIAVGQLTIRYLRDGAQDGQIGAFELTVPPGSNVPPPHRHTNNEELVYVLDGKLRYSVNAESRDLGPGETMFTPKGEVHGFSNPFDVPARALITLSPEIGARYFRDVAAVVNAGGPPGKARLVEVMARSGLEPAEPS